MNKFGKFLIILCAPCYHVQVCMAGNETPIKSIKCHAATPFCENGVCTSVPGSCALHGRSSNFICTSAGVFPGKSHSFNKYYSFDGITEF